MKSILSSILLGCSLIASAPAQSTGQVGKNTLFEIPRPAPNTWNQKADHATVAMNDSGDVVVVWVGEGVTKRLEGMFFSKHSTNVNDTWGFADPVDLSAVLGISGDCEKPDVVAVGDDFVISWTEVAADGSGEVQAVVLKAEGYLASGYRTATIVSDPATGGPFSLGDLDPNQCKGVVDLAANSSGEIFACYASLAGPADQHQNGVQGDLDMEFKLIGVEFSLDPVSKEIALGDDFLIDTLDFDRIQAIPASDTPFGRILPDCDFDGEGNLVVAAEYFDQDDRGDINSGIQTYWLKKEMGAMEIKYQVFMSELGLGQDADRPQRRPNVRRSSDDSETVVVTWASPASVDSSGVITESGVESACLLTAGDSTGTWTHSHDFAVLPQGSSNQDDCERLYPSPSRCTGSAEPGDPYEVDVVSAETFSGGDYLTVFELRRDAAGNQTATSNEVLQGENFWRPAVANQEAVGIHALTVEGKLVTANSQRIHIIFYPM